MKLRTKAQISGFLDGELAWRKRELTTIKFAIDGARDHVASMLRRAGVALLYAHFEGFVKVAGTAYLEFVSRQGLSHAQLKPNLFALAIKRELNDAKESTKAELFTKVAAFFVEQIGSKADVPWRNVVQTKSNLSAEVMRNIIATLGFDYGPYATQEKTIIERLREARNNIAHGRLFEVDETEYRTLHDSVVMMLNTYRDQVEGSVQTSGFQR